jgi:hypothetical protein
LPTGKKSWLNTVVPNHVNCPRKFANSKTVTIVNKSKAFLEDYRNFSFSSIK